MNLFKVSVLILTVLQTVVQTTVGAENQKPLNLIPMYGAPLLVKTLDQMQADNEFLANVTANGVTRDSAAVGLWSMGMKALFDRDKETAMKRFNQSWLLDPDCFLAYWGFGKVTFTIETLQEALGYFDRSLAMLQTKKQRASLRSLNQGLYYDMGKAYSIAALADSLNASVYCKRADNLFERLYHENPTFAEGYTLWVMNAIRSKDFTRAWSVVHTARRAGITIPDWILKTLSEKMPEPKM